MGKLDTFAPTSPAGNISNPSGVESDTRDDISAVLSGSMRRSKKSPIAYLSKDDIIELRNQGKIGPFLDRAYRKIQGELQPKNNKKAPWQRILSAAIHEWNILHIARPIELYYGKVGNDGKKIVGIWKNKFGISTIEDAFSFFGMNLNDDIQRFGGYLSKEDCTTTHNESIRNFMQEYLRVNADTLWRRKYQSWQQTLSLVIGAWNATHPYMKIYNYMTEADGNTQSGHLWKEKYGITTKDEALNFFGITLPEKKIRKIPAETPDETRYTQ